MRTLSKGDLKMEIKVVAIKELEPGYTKGKYYSSPIYRRNGRVELETGEIIEHTFSALKLKKLNQINESVYN